MCHEIFFFCFFPNHLKAIKTILSSQAIQKQVAGLYRALPMSSANSCSKKTKVKIWIYSQDTISGVGCSLYKENAPVYSFKNRTPLGSDNMAPSTQICHGGTGVPPALPPPQLSFQADEVRENDSMKQVKPGKTVRGNIQQGRREAQAMGRKVPKTLHLAANVHCSFSEFPDR